MDSVDLGGIDILTTLSPLTREHRMSFLFFPNAFFHFFDQLFIVFRVQVLHTSLVEFIPKHFILSNAVVSGILKNLPLRVDSVMSFSKFILLCNLHHNLVLKLLHHPQNSFVSLCSQSLSTPPNFRQPLICSPSL